MPTPSPAPRPSSRRRFGLRLLLALATTVLALAAGEMLVRFSEWSAYHKAAHDWHHFLFVLQPESPLLFTLLPDHERVNRVPGRDGFAWSYRINPEGFRGPTWGAKRPGVHRVLALGDSYTFGWAVEETDTWPAQVERLLNDGSAAPSWEVLNAGVPGYGTSAEAALLEAIGPGLAPDAVVLGYVMNDAEPPGTVPLSPDLEHRVNRSWLLARCKQLYNRIFFPEKGGLDVHLYQLSYDYLAGFRPESPKWRDSRTGLEAIARWCRARHIPLLVFVFPDFSQEFGSSYPYTAIHSCVARWGEELDIQVEDLFPLFEGRDHTAYFVEGDGHPDARAFALIAPVVAESVRHSPTG